MASNPLGTRQTRKLSVKEIERKARSILRKLRHEGNILSPIQQPYEISGEILYGLVCSHKTCHNPTIKVRQDYVEAFYARQWIERLESGRYCLSRVGHAWLKRADALKNAFQEQHLSISQQIRTDKSGIKHSVTVNDAESPLAWLWKRKNKSGKALIENYQFEAGERLRADFTFAQLMPSVTTNWAFNGAESGDKRQGTKNSHLELRENIVAAKIRVTNALDAVGPELSGIIIDVCCHLKGLEEAEKLQGWPQRSGKVVLQLALTRLARHYGLVSDETCSKNYKQKHILHWGEEDYRPVIE